MKTNNLVTWIAFSMALIAPDVFAQQSGVTIYGAIDTMVRHTDNEITNGTVGDKTKMEEGVLQGPRLGFKGQEDLGSGTSAVFQLEMGFGANDGVADQQGQLFGRQAFVGLKNTSLGEIDVGRQYGVALETMANYDPLGMGNLPENAWQLYLVGIRFDNSLKYTNTWGPFNAEVQYSFGSQSGSTSIGSTSGLGLGYSSDPFNIGVFAQQSTDANSNKVTITGIGAKLKLEQTSVFMNYFNAKRDAGFVTAVSNSGGALSNTSQLNNVGNSLQRKDDVVTVGVLYQAAPNMAYTLGYMADSVKNESSSGNSGKISTVYAVADYSFSKRTSIYVDVDYTKVSGGEIDNGQLTNTVMQFVGAGLGGATSRTGVAVGLRTKF